MKKSMKLNFYLPITIFFLLTTFRSTAQSIIIPTTNPTGTGLTQSPWRKPFGTNRSYERTAIKYTHAEINASGQITQIGFYCDTINNPGFAKTKIYLKEVTDSTFTASTVAAEQSGAILVFNDSIPASAFLEGQWIMVTLQVPFIYTSTNNLEVIVETNSGGTVGTETAILAKGFRYSAVTGAREQYWQSAVNSSAIPTGNGTLMNGNRHNIQLVFNPVTACSGTPVAGSTIANPGAVCGNNPVGLSLSGATVGTGLTYQWISSSDSLNWSPIAGAINPSLSTSLSSPTYFACVITCSGQSDTSLVSFVNVNPFYNCYCVTGIGGGCTTQATAIDSVAIGGTSLANGPTGCSAGFYTAYPNSGNTTTILTQGQAYQFYTKYNGNVKSSVWIDYNHNGVFEPAEWTQLCLTSTANTIVTTQVNIPLGALTGLTGMRIRSRAANGTNDSTTSCTTFGTGETEDYLITINAAQNCISPPTPGIASVNNDTICPTNSVVLTLSGFTSGLGTGIQWISSTDGGNSWNNVNGGNNPTLNNAPNVNTLYACIVTCSGQSDTSTFASVTVKPFYNCYCVNGIGGGCVNTPGSTIDSVAIDMTTLANGLTGCSPGFYTMYPAVGNTTATLVMGLTYNIHVLLQGNARCQMWIDYNQNGIFEPVESTQICTTSTAGVVNTKSFQVPMNTSIMGGLTGMRIRTRSTAGALDSTSACSNFGSGETEDYLVNLTFPLGLQSEKSESNLYIFPNPSNDGLMNFVFNQENKSSAKIEVLTLNGVLAHSEELGTLQSGTINKSANLKELAKGVYFFKLTSGEKVMFKKIILQ
jgi:hypothetical protein